MCGHEFILQAAREIAMRETAREAEKSGPTTHRPMSSLQTIRRALNSQASTIQHVRIDHGRLQAAVAQQLLDRSDIRTAFQ